MIGRRMARTALHVVVAAAVVLAGCNGVVVDSPPQTPERTATPEPVTYPPGVTDTGVTDAVELVAAHGRAARNRSYVAVRTTTVEYPNGSRTRWNLTNRRDAERDVYYLTQRISGPTSRLHGRTEFELWSNGSVAVGVIREDGDVRYFRDSEDYARRATRARLLSLFTKIETTTTGTTTDGRPLVHLLGTDVAASRLRPSRARNLSDVSFSAAVTPEGLVRSYTLRYEGELDGERVRVVEEFRLRSRTGQTVDRPAWVQVAANRTNASG